MNIAGLPPPSWKTLMGSSMSSPTAAHLEAANWLHAYGWRRSFCLNLTTFRGTPDQPGLMLALDYGGCCDGVLVQADEGMELEGVEALLKREIDYAEDVPYGRWITVRSGNKRVRALTFYVAPRGDGLTVHLPIKEQASRIAR